MNEHAPTVHPEHHLPQTFGEVLKTHHDNLHPHLREHIFRLAVENDPEPPPSVTDLADKLRQRATSPDTDPMEPLLSADEQIEVKNALARRDYSADDLSGFLEGAIRSSITLQKRAAKQGKTPYTPPLEDFMTVLETLPAAPAGIIRTLYHTSTINKPLRYLLERATPTMRHTGVALQLLEKAYDTADIFGLIALKDSDPLLKHLLDNPDGQADYAIAQRIKEPDPAWSDDKDPRQADLARHEWASRYLKEVVRLPDDLRHDLEFSSFSRNYNQSTKRLNPNFLAGMLTRTAIVARYHGVEKLAELRDKAGIINFDYYKITRNPDTGKAESLLDSTSKLIEGDPAMIEHLQAGDVTVVFTDGRSDYDGGLIRTPRNYATANNRTLYFELNTPQDLYRHMTLLKKYGIKPSTIIMQAHGAPGMMNLGDWQANNAFLMTNQYRHPRSKNWPEKTGTLLEAQGIARIVNEYMQDSRGIDDNPEAAGRRRLFLVSCEQATPQTVIRPKEHDGRIAYIQTQESMVETLALLVNNPDVDFYASDEESRVKRTKRGLRYERQVYLPDGKPRLDINGDPVFTPFAATHVRTDSHGRLVKSHVEEIAVRQSNPDKKAA